MSARKVSRKRGTTQEEEKDPVKAMASTDLFDLAWGTLSELATRSKEDPEVALELWRVLSHFEENKSRLD